MEKTRGETPGTRAGQLGGKQKKVVGWARGKAGALAGREGTGGLVTTGPYNERELLKTTGVPSIIHPPPRLVLFWAGAMSAIGMMRVGLPGSSSTDESLAGAATGTADTACSQRITISPPAESAFQPATSSVEAPASRVENIPNPTPAVGRRVTIAWTVDGRERSLTGVVVDHRMQLLKRNTTVTDFKVKYDKDQAVCWHAADAAWDAAEDAGYCDGGWVLVNDTCSITKKPLTIPARTGTCQHVARCNLDDLALWKRVCPDCGATFRGRKSLVVDGLLRDELALARSAGKQVWQSTHGAYALRDHRNVETVYLD